MSEFRDDPIGQSNRRAIRRADMLQKSATDSQQTAGLRNSSCGWLSSRNRSDRPARKVLGVTAAKLRRSRDKDHLRFIAIHPCIVWQAALRGASLSVCTAARAGAGCRMSSQWLCRVHYRELHRQGDERLWWNKANIDPMPIALGFWQQTRGVVSSRKRRGESND